MQLQALLDGAEEHYIQVVRWLCTKSRKFMDAWKNPVTLKALANVSPGF
jgi:hypothetical protein